MGQLSNRKNDLVKKNDQNWKQANIVSFEDCTDIK